jgi:hypothetical protein
MKVLVCIVSHEMNSRDLLNIQILDKYMKESGNTVEYAGISSKDDFSTFEDVIQFKYKFICLDRQLTKLCKFIDKFRPDLNYDWYIKIRPDIRLLQQIDFSSLNPQAINARTREYEGPKSIKYATSVPDDILLEPRAFRHNFVKKLVTLDDQIYIFHNTVIKKFDVRLIPSSIEIEWQHTAYWNLLNIPLNIIGINVLFTKNNWTSGNLGPKGKFLFGLQK